MLSEKERMIWFEETKDRIKKVRIPMYKLAEMCHLSRMTLAGWYRGRYTPTGLGLYAINRALDALDLSAQYAELAEKRANDKKGRAQAKHR
jgi:hypothetical protein